MDIGLGSIVSFFDFPASIDRLYKINEWSCLKNAFLFLYLGLESSGQGSCSGRQVMQCGDSEDFLRGSRCFCA